MIKILCEALPDLIVKDYIRDGHYGIELKMPFSHVEVVGPESQQEALKEKAIIMFLKSLHKDKTYEVNKLLGQSTII